MFGALKVIRASQAEIRQTDQTVRIRIRVDTLADKNLKIFQCFNKYHQNMLIFFIEKVA